MGLGTEYLWKCRENYFLKITPGCENCQQEKGYIELEQIAVQYIKESGAADFSGFFMEYQYLVDLWTAHMLLQHADITPELKENCLNVIKSYSTTTLNETIAKEETLWLARYAY